MPFSREQKEIIGGLACNVTDAYATQPIDQVKTQFHVSKAARDGSVLKALGEQARSGGVPRLYRGVTAAALRPQSLCMYVGNEYTKRLVGGPAGKLSWGGAALAGFLTGYIESPCTNPFEVVKVRMQSKEHVGRFRNSWHCAKEMLATEGVGAFYTGFGATLMRNCVYNGVYFGSVYALRDLAPPPESDSVALKAGHDFMTGMTAAFVGVCVKQPLDVVKSRIQNQVPGPNGALEFTSVAQAIPAIYRTEGPLALYKGFTATVMRLGLGSAVALATFDATMACLSSAEAEAKRMDEATAAAFAPKPNRMEEC